MFSLTGFPIRFTPSLRISIVAFIAILLFLRLGVWQVHRAHEKKQMIIHHQIQAKQAPTAWHINDPLPQQYQRVQVEGEFLAHPFLLDNQYYHHKIGYQVLSPLLVTADQVILVDRGWLQDIYSRRMLPSVTTPCGKVVLIGEAYYPSSKKVTLGPLIEQNKTNVTLIEVLEPALVGKILHKSVQPFIMRLNRYEPYGYVREWPVVSMPPERHKAYALQWFAMALVTFIAWIALIMKKL